MMKRSIPFVLLLVSLSTLSSCDASFTSRGFEEFGFVSQETKAELRSAIVGMTALSGLQLLLFGLDLSGPAALEPVDCSDGGTALSTFDVDVEPLGKLSSGDRVRVVFDGCSDGDTTYQGTVLFGFDTVIGDTETDPIWSVSATLEAQDLVRAGSSSQRVINGSLMLQVDYQDGDIRIAFSGSATIAVSDALGMRTRTVDDLEQEWNYSADTGLASHVVSAQFSSDLVEGVFSIKTVEPLVGEPFQIPDSGELVLTGAEESSLSLVVDDGEIVRVRLDQDGDGLFDDIQSLLWNDL